MLPVQLVQPMCTGLPSDLCCSAGERAVCSGLCPHLCAGLPVAMLDLRHSGADGGPDDATIHGSASDAHDDAGPANVLPIADANVLRRS